MDIVKELNFLQEKFSLEKRAFEGADKWVSSEDFDLSPEIKSQLMFEFKYHKLCFKHNDLNYSYIETTLRIYYQQNEVGYYTYFCDLDGEAVDDALIILNEDLKSS